MSCPEGLCKVKKRFSNHNEVSYYNRCDASCILWPFYLSLKMNPVVLNSILLYIGLFAVFAIVLFLIIKSIKENVERQRIRRKNREYQFSGRAHSENESGSTSLFSRSRKSRAEILGERGERKVSSYLEDLPYEDYQVFNDILIRDGSYTTQIDHIIISHFGVFVIETKNIHGKVYGSYHSEYWKQYLPDSGYKRFGFTQEHKLRNPLWQNKGHIKSLRRLVFGNDVPVHGIVAFPNDTDLHVDCEREILKMWDIVSYIKLFEDDVLSAEQMSFYRRRLLEVISTSESDRLDHIDNIYRNQNRRDSAVAAGMCPRCGGRLVLRNGKYGQFWGCSNYPKCTYILHD